MSHTSKRTVDNKTKNMAFFLNRSSEVKNLTTYLQLAVVKADPYLKTIANIIGHDKVFVRGNRLVQRYGANSDGNENTMMNGHTLVTS